jgi:hypothetical protein
LTPHNRRVLGRRLIVQLSSLQKKLLEDDGGFVVKFDGMPVQPSQTPQDFGMLVICSPLYSPPPHWPCLPGFL